MTTIKLIEGTELHPTDDELAALGEVWGTDSDIEIQGKLIRMQYIVYVDVPEEEKPQDTPEAREERMNRLRNWKMNRGRS